MDCLFCKIIKREITANIIFENESILAFQDIKPQAPHHILIIPKKHIATLNDVTPAEQNLMGAMILTAIDLAAKLGIADKGYRTVFNCNASGGQLVYHLHLHLLGGRQMTWPPG